MCSFIFFYCPFFPHFDIRVMLVSQNKLGTIPSSSISWSLFRIGINSVLNRIWQWGHLACSFNCEIFFLHFFLHLISLIDTYIYSDFLSLKYALVTCVFLLRYQFVGKILSLMFFYYIVNMCRICKYVTFLISDLRNFFFPDSSD